MTKLGQHFLIDKSALKTIVSALDMKPNDTIIEIGPGHGELTLEIKESTLLNFSEEKLGRARKSSLKIIAIEKDKELAKNLELKIKKLGLKNIEIVKGDALKVLPALHTKYKIQNTRYKIVGNIPYYITGYLLRILGELENKPKLVVLTIQKEVAERIAAKPPRMNLLAASVQVWAIPEILSIIGKKSFSPPPEVDSAIIKLSPRTGANWTRINADNYYRLIKILFKQPRKTILNNLTAGLEKPRAEIERKLKALGINPSDRPQNLTIPKIKDLTAEFYAKK